MRTLGKDSGLALPNAPARIGSNLLEDAVGQIRLPFGAATERLRALRDVVLTVQYGDWPTDAQNGEEIEVAIYLCSFSVKPCTSPHYSRVLFISGSLLDA